MAAAMMGDFQHGGTHVTAALQQKGFGFLLDIPGEEKAHTTLD